MNAFKVGDRIQVVRDYTTSFMPLLGEKGAVVEVDPIPSASPYRVRLDRKGLAYWFGGEDLALDLTAEGVAGLIEWDGAEDGTVGESDQAPLAVHDFHEHITTDAHHEIGERIVVGNHEVRVTAVHPHGDGWRLEVENANPDGMDALLTAAGLPVRVFNLETKRAQVDAEVARFDHEFTATVNTALAKQRAYDALADMVRSEVRSGAASAQLCAAFTTFSETIR